MSDDSQGWIIKYYLLQRYAHYSPQDAEKELLLPHTQENCSRITLPIRIQICGYCNA